jgi:2-C-methyl-D-erythritol 4-phosphate cytidylyltransferase / 2-C-methyl-D-erythritol 2,4-cyclodiphosphate synthase
MNAFAIVPAAGSGSRLGRPEPKALVPLAGKPILQWTLEALEGVPFLRTVVAAPPERIADFERLLSGQADVVAGGETRPASVRAGFYALSCAPGDVVCIHDAARPFVTREEVAAVVREAERVGAAIAATPIVDTVKKAEGARVLGTLDRTGLYAAGTPQAFRADLLAAALASGRESTDEAALLELAGLPVAIVTVSRLGFKVTHPEDLELCEAILARRGVRRLRDSSGI